MATLITDSMTDTDATTLQSHTADTGGSYTKYPGYTDDAVIQNDGSTSRLRGNGVVSVFSQYTHATAPPKADYSVQVGIVAVTVLIADTAGIMGRADATVSAGNDTYYYSQIAVEASLAGTLTLSKAVAGVFTELGSYNMGTLTAGQTYVVLLEMIGSGIKVYLDGTERISVTDSAVSGATERKAGPYVSGSTDLTGLHEDNLSVTYVASLPSQTRSGPAPAILAM